MSPPQAILWLEACSFSSSAAELAEHWGELDAETQKLAIEAAEKIMARAMVKEAA